MNNLDENLLYLYMTSEKMEFWHLYIYFVALWIFNLVILWCDEILYTVNVIIFAWKISFHVGVIFTILIFP